MSDPTEPTAEEKRTAAARYAATQSPKRPIGERPHPGSDEAIAKGCICAVADNNYGRFPPHRPDGWWVTEACVVHGTGSRIQGAHR